MELGKDLVAASATPLVLAILAEGDSYGYAIIKRVHDLSGGHLHWTDGMLYPVLHRLERQGLVAAKWGVSETGRRRKYYRITRDGRAQLAVQREQWRVVDDTFHAIWMTARAGMSASVDHLPLEEQIAQWRGYLRRRRAINGPDVEELEGHLRDQVAVLTQAGLAGDEAFLVAVKRMGSLDALSREFAREHSERLWKQLVIAPDAGTERADTARTEVLLVIGLAIAAALAIKTPALFGLQFGDEHAPFYARNASLFVLPLLTGYFAWKRGLPAMTAVLLALPFVAAAVFANVYPFAPESHTLVLTALHLPIALWLAVGVAYAGCRWFAGSARMDFVRFSGELFIYYVLIALGGGVLTGFTVMMFEAIGMNVEWLAGQWIIPCGAMGAVLVGSWLVEAKQSVVENMAPVLTRLFTPLFTVVLLVFLATMLWTGSPIRRGAGGADRVRPAAGAGRGAGALRGVGARSAGATGPLRRAATGAGRDARWWWTRWRWRPSPPGSRSSASPPTGWRHSGRT